MPVGVEDGALVGGEARHGMIVRRDDGETDRGLLEGCAMQVDRARSGVVIHPVAQSAPSPAGLIPHRREAPHRMNVKLCSGKTVAAPQAARHTFNGFCPLTRGIRPRRGRPRDGSRARIPGKWGAVPPQRPWPRSGCRASPGRGSSSPPPRRIPAQCPAAAAARASSRRNRRCRWRSGTAAGPQHPGERGERRIRDEAALALAALRPGIGIEQVDPVEAGIAARRPAAPWRPRRRSARWRAPRSSIARRSLAMPLTKGSPPMKPSRDGARPGRARCSPPPKPISSQTARICSGNRPAGSAPRRRQAQPQLRQQLRRDAPARPAAACPCGGRRRPPAPSAPPSPGHGRASPAQPQAGAEDLSARSVRSQEKPPSASGARPKCP